MKQLIREIRLYAFIKLLVLAIRVLPKGCTKTLNWFTSIPSED